MTSAALSRSLAPLGFPLFLLLSSCSFLSSLPIAARRRSTFSMQRTSAARLLVGAIPTRLQPVGASPRPLRPHRPPAVPPLLQRWYQHTSKHAPNSAISNEASRDQATNRSGIAYTRHELLADWHSYARKISPLDVQWKGKDQIEAQCEYSAPGRNFSLCKLRDPGTQGLRFR